MNIAPCGVIALALAALAIFLLVVVVRARTRGTRVLLLVGTTCLLAVEVFAGNIGYSGNAKIHMVACGTVANAATAVRDRPN